MQAQLEILGHIRDQLKTIKRKLQHELMIRTIKLFELKIGPFIWLDLKLMETMTEQLNNKEILIISHSCSHKNKQLVS